MFDFDSIDQYDNYVINLSDDDYRKMIDCINILKRKYNRDILELYCLEKVRMKEFDFNKQFLFIKRHKELVFNIILEVLDCYKDELANLEVVFLSGSLARGTNKTASDIDLHFFYNDWGYNYIYEEIVCYIITEILGKNRDSIDPTFIFNMGMDKKRLVTSKMTLGNLEIILRSNKEFRKYSYKVGKKRRFYLQYLNKRKIDLLFDYLNDELLKDNWEWIHCFEVIKGNELFYEFYDKLYWRERLYINDEYIKLRINALINKFEKMIFDNSLRMISDIKKNYQSVVFEGIYEYVSIIRFILIEKNYIVKYLNLWDIYEIIKDKSFFLCDVFIEIYRYMWTLEKLSFYCRENKIDYGLHNDEVIDYSLEELESSFRDLRGVIVEDLRRLKMEYE